MRSEDIAILAGVSRSTVSRVLNNYHYIPQKTRDKVLKIIEQYHYEPNTSARVLAGKATNTIGLFVISADGHNYANRIYQNNYFAPFVDAVIDTANAAGYYVLVHTVFSKEDIGKVRQAFLQKRIDGSIVVGSRKDIDMAKELCSNQMPLVLIDYDVEELKQHQLIYDQLAVINSNDYEGAYSAIQYLIRLGHRDIAFISEGDSNTYSGQQRFQAYLKALHDHRLPLREQFVLQGDFSKRTAYEAVLQLLDRGQDQLPTAIFSANDDMALGALEAFKERGIRVPDDISIIGFDDVPVASQLIPGLTSVRLPIYGMSQAAVHRIITICEGGESTFTSDNFATQLIVRETCRSRE